MRGSGKTRMEELRLIAEARRKDANSALDDLLKAESEFAAEHFNCNVGDVIVGRRTNEIPGVLYLVKGFTVNSDGKPVIEAAQLEERHIVGFGRQHEYDYLYATAVDPETAPRVFRGDISGGGE